MIWAIIHRWRLIIVLSSVLRIDWGCRYISIDECVDLTVPIRCRVVVEWCCYHFALARPQGDAGGKDCSGDRIPECRHHTMPVIGRAARSSFQPVVVVFSNMAESVEAKRIDSLYGEPVCAFILPRWPLPVCSTVSFSKRYPEGWSINTEAESGNFAKRW